MSRIPLRFEYVTRAGQLEDLPASMHTQMAEERDQQLEDYLASLCEDVWPDLRVPLSTTKVGSTNPPTEVIWRNNGAGSTGISGLRFSATQLNQVFFEAQLPHSYKEGSRIAPHCHFTTVSTPTVGQTVRFGLEYTYSNVGGVFPATTIIYAERTFVTGDAAYQQYIGGFDPDIEDANLTLSAMISARFFRDAAHANDTYTGTVTVLEVDFHYLTESRGSVFEFSK